MPVKTENMPKNMKNRAIFCPILDAFCVAEKKFFFLSHKIDLKTLPPSNGKPGMRLNTAMIRLIWARYEKRAFIPAVVFTDKKKKRAERKKLETGPAIAILNSALGCGGSPFICATPPKMKRVMLSMKILYLLATMEWASS